MANGDMLDELQNILRSENTLPDKITNRMIISALRNFSDRLDEVKGELNKLSAIVNNLQAAYGNITGEQKRKERTWEWWRDEILAKVFILIVGAAIGWIVAHLK